MRYGDYRKLRRKAKISAPALAQATGIPKETVEEWETVKGSQEVPRGDAQAIRAVLLPILLGKPILKHCDEAFRKVPSESVAIWVVQERECILLPNASRLHDLDRNKRAEAPTVQCVAPLVQESLTTYPLRSGETLNLAGKGITAHPAKKFKQNRSNFIFHSGICESILHVPAMIKSSHGPQPVLLLSFENKLNKAKKEAIVPKTGDTKPVYSPADEKIARELAEKFKNDLVPTMKLLDMLDFS